MSQGWLWSTETWHGVKWLKYLIYWPYSKMTIEECVLNLWWDQRLCLLSSSFPLSSLWLHHHILWICLLLLIEVLFSLGTSAYFCINMHYVDLICFKYSWPSCFVSSPLPLPTLYQLCCYVHFIDKKRQNQVFWPHTWHSCPGHLALDPPQ